MQRFVRRHRYKFLVVCIVILLLLTEHIIHSFMRSHNYWRESYSDSITPGSQIKVYDESELTEDEFNKLFYGEDYESEDAE